MSGPRLTHEAAASAGSASAMRHWLPLVLLIAMALVVRDGMASLLLSFKTIGLNYEALQGLHRAQSRRRACALRRSPTSRSSRLSLPGALIMTLAGGLLFGWQIGAPRPSSAPPSARRSCSSSPAPRSARGSRPSAGPSAREAARRLPGECAELPAVPAPRAGVPVRRRQPRAGPARRAACAPTSLGTFLGIIPGTTAYLGRRLRPRQRRRGAERGLQGLPRQGRVGAATPRAPTRSTPARSSRRS